jgi:hypothetical protein
MLRKTVRLKWEPAKSTLWLHRATLNSTPHQASTSEEQALPAVFLAATPSADFDYSCPAITINSRPVTSRAPPQASHNASGVFTARINKRAYHLQSSINRGYPRFLINQQPPHWFELFWLTIIV